ncbi:hypothetical protein [Xanthobacter oligotrophicus]|uniref:hypothetical protein n=1 Tax=Xanthobacter oligotrophicus TaxID=2607286 RepID=UPI0011F1A28D|nr:hypothetical protein [Xanthobacter oligotrophicus]MCG5236788.1 hypothetical protein [Xanthobacter oligotrophicus]
MTTSTDAFAAVTLLFGALPLEAAPIPCGGTDGHGACSPAASAPRHEGPVTARRPLLSRLATRVGGWGR